jgi:hypothetical protein
MEADWHGNIWIDLQLNLAEIEAEIPDIPDEPPHIPTVGNAMANVGLRGAIDDALNRMHQDHADSDDSPPLSYTVKMTARSRVHRT